MTWTPEARIAVIEAATREVLDALGENAEREGLRDTPNRVARAWLEMTAGYAQDPKELLSTAFDSDMDQMVVVRGIPFESTCEHHLLPFMGEAHVAYVPKGRVVGLSKIPRLVRCFAKRLQIQEQMTHDIATTMMEVLEPAGVGVIVKAHHLCMRCRGVRDPKAEMITSSLHGVMLKHGREEFLRLISL